MDEHHGLAGCDADGASAVIPATAYGLQNTSMTQFIASVAVDAKALLADIPKIFSASSRWPPLANFPKILPT